jgi:hypothetical protein
MGGYTSKCEKKSKSLHPTGQPYKLNTAANVKSRKHNVKSDCMHGKGGKARRQRTFKGAQT